jgi:uncharacterized protein (DUF1697 family)
MTRYVAFLRAINVGGHVVKMEDLRRLFEAIGFASVETFIQSGNVIFDSPARQAAPLESKIEKQLQQALGYEVITFVRSLPELAEIAQYDPFNGAERAAGATLYVAFLRATLKPEAQRQLLALRTENFDFQAHQREVYWLRRKQKEPVVSGAFLEKALGVPATVRNSTTVRKIIAKYLPDSR